MSDNNYFNVSVYFTRTRRQVKRLESIAKSPIFSHFTESIQVHTGNFFCVLRFKADTMFSMTETKPSALTSHPIQVLEVIKSVF